MRIAKRARGELSLEHQVFFFYLEPISIYWLYQVTLYYLIHDLSFTSSIRPSLAHFAAATDFFSCPDCSILCLC